MALFQYKAMNRSGRMIYGRLDAINAVDLEMRLKRMELDYINGSPVQSGSAFGNPRVSRRELINFCFHLDQMARAGVSIVEALTDLRDSLENPRFREVIAGLIESIEGGRTLSQSLAQHPQVFDEVFTSLIRAGEDSGNLPDVLTNLTETIKWQDELAAHTKKLVTYPIFLGVIVVSVFFFMMIYLVPKMVGFIKNMGQQLPPQTKLLIWVSDLMVGYWGVFLLLPPALMIGLKIMAMTNPGVQRGIDQVKLSVPLLGDILHKIILSRFAGVFAMMYSSGISILESIRATESVVGNIVVREALEEVGQLISEGTQVTAAFQQVGIFPPLVIRMLRVGENTGGLDTALRNVSYFYNRDVKESIGRVQALIEPAMTIFVGLVLGWVMLAVLGPIYDTISKLKI